MEDWKDQILRDRERVEAETGKTPEYVIVHPSVWTELCANNYRLPPDMEGMVLAVSDTLIVPYVFAVALRQEDEE